VTVAGQLLRFTHWQAELTKEVQLLLQHDIQDACEFVRARCFCMEKVSVAARTPGDDRRAASGCSTSRYETMPCCVLSHVLTGIGWIVAVRLHSQRTCASAGPTSAYYNFQT
jgi:hypothetical protein